MYKLCFYVPEAQLEQVKHALFKIGAGRIGHYEHCCWQILGEGQFKPLEGAKPFVGSEGNIHKLLEYKVEMVVDDGLIKSVVKELKRVHPYEEPAYEVYKLASLPALDEDFPEIVDLPIE